MSIKILVMDVDGTMTDGQIYIGSEGELFKSFNVKDGLGISKLSMHNIKPIIITGRTSKITLNRSKELGITDVYQGEKSKYNKLLEVIQQLNIDITEVAFIGDDVNDLECIKKSGLTGCPNDAVKEVKLHVDYICNSKGGQGAVREFIEVLIKE